MSLFIQPEIVDRKRRRAAIDRLRQAGVLLPTWSELADPGEIEPQAMPLLAQVDPDSPDAANLWRVHWFNSPDRKSLIDIPGHIVLPSELTGVKAPIVVLLGCRFPMIGAHKVLAAYACLVPRLVTGQFDPSNDRAIWPSTGNYCRGGVAISRILGCRGVAVLPAGMSRERFDWLQQWVADSRDIIRTPGTESNVKEIYDKCRELSRDKQNVIYNQFSEFANYLIHYHCTGHAFDRVFHYLKWYHRKYRLAALVAATGSAGTIAAGDLLKKLHGTKIAAVEAAECPTMLCNGMLAGLVAITAPCAFVGPWAAGVIGFVAGVLVIYSVFFFENRGVDDPCGAISVHGTNGAWGVLSLGLFANGAYGAGWNGVVRDSMVSAYGADGVRGLFYGDVSQFVAQVISVITIGVFGFVMAYVWFKISDMITPLRVDAETELQGLDGPEVSRADRPPALKLQTQ